MIALLYGRVPRKDAEWRELLAIADRALCTPLLRGTSGLPPWFSEEIEQRIAKIALRRNALLETYAQAASALQKSGIEFVLIKGFTHEADAGLDSVLRAQGDIDLLCPRDDLSRAEQALLAGGFEFHGGTELSDNHSRPLLKPYAWQWQGDYFDPAQPIPVELHHAIWNPRRDRIATPGVHQFWTRRISLNGIPAFCDVDRIAVAALHVLRHILGNNVRLGHVWELKRMLDRRADDADFWRCWSQLHPDPLRELQVIAFRFACAWFSGDMPPVPAQDWNRLPSRVQAWFERSAFAPVENLTSPNKAALWLHLELLPDFRDRWSVARRRLLPLRVPRPGETEGSYLRHLARRGRYHALALARALGSGLRASTTRSRASHTSD